MLSPIILTKTKFACCLATEDPEARNIFTMYMVYKTVEHNRRLTINSVKALLTCEYMLSEVAIDAALAGLVSRSTFACVNRWKAPGKHVGTTQLSVVSPVPPTFSEWLDWVETQYPELLVFSPPEFRYKHSA
jgi:hypothetical protein